MEIDQHQLVIGPFHGESADEQAALQIGDPQGPGEGTGQGNPVRLADFGPAEGIEAAFHMADGRKGIGHVKGMKVIGEGRGRAGQNVPERFPFVRAVAAVGGGVHLLQEQQVRVQPGEGLADAFQILGHPLPVRRIDAGAAVHEEIGVISQGAVAEIPGDEGQGLRRFDAGGDAVIGDEGFLIRGAVFRDSQDAQGQDEDQHKPEQNQAEDFQSFFHEFNLLSGDL